MIKITKIMAYLTMVFSIVGCAGIPLASIVKLRNVNPGTTNLSILRVSVQVPLAILPQQDGISLEMKIKPEPGEALMSHKFGLKLLPHGAYSDELLKYRNPGAKMMFFRLAETDVPRFDKLRNLLDSNGKRRGGELRVQTELCRIAGVEVKTIPVSVFLKTEETREFVPLVLNRDLMEELDGRMVPGC